jgi:hypothetical protein
MKLFSLKYSFFIVLIFLISLAFFSFIFYKVDALVISKLYLINGNRQDNGSIIYKPDYSTISSINGNGENITKRFDIDNSPSYVRVDDSSISVFYKIKIPTSNNNGFNILSEKETVDVKHVGQNRNGLKSYSGILTLRNSSTLLYSELIQTSNNSAIYITKLKE